MRGIHIVLFDGECNFCNFWVKFIIERDKKDVFRFASLQSEKGGELLKEHNLELNLSTVVLINQRNSFSRCYTKSDAALNIMYYLGGIYSLTIVFMVVPRFIRDYIYDVIAKNRKRLLKNESCIIPNATIRTKFL